MQTATENCSRRNWECKQNETRKMAVISVILLTIASSPITAQSQSEQTAHLPNVVIIYSDDHGYTDLGIHGIDGNVDTPNMDALARGGALMKAGYSSAPQCR